MADPCLRAGLAALFLLFLLLLSATPALAADIRVNDTCSFGDAIRSANQDSPVGGCTAGSGDDVIILTRNFTLKAHGPPISASLTIDGRGFTVDGADQWRHIDIPEGSITVVLKDIALTRGRGISGLSGGAITLGGSATAEARPRLTLNRVTVSDSSAINHGGGGLACRNGHLTVNDSVFSGNQTAVSGGGLFLKTGCVATISRSAIHNNSAVNGGGGIGTDAGFQGITMTNSTVYGNSVKSGWGSAGGLSFGAGGSGTIELRHLTITGNSNESGAGAGIGFVWYGQVHLRNSIVYGNSGTQECYHQDNSITTNENNIIGSPAGNCGAGTNVSDDDPRLPDSPGGRVPYFALPTGSPAIDAAGDCSSLITEDQRGRARPYGGACDIGAYEWHPPPPPQQEQAAAASQPLLPATCETLPANVMVANRSADTRCQQVSGAGIGVAALVEGGARESVDVWNAVAPGTKVCFAAAGGSIQFLDAAGMPRRPEELAVYSEGDMLCAMIDRPGTAVLMPGPAPAPPPAPVPAAPAAPAAAAAPAAQGLGNCMVRTTHILNLRSGPGGAIQSLVPYNVTLTAFQRNDGWYEVDYHGARGWISANYVVPQGDCG